MLPKMAPVYLKWNQVEYNAKLQIWFSQKQILGWLGCTF